MGNSKPPEKILMVDDEANLLSSFKRELRGKINLDTALGGEEALRKINGSPPYAVVVSDFKMPGMNGVQLLAKVREVCPDSVRMMLTGYADLDSTIKAVNEGNIFRFLTKPCDSETLVQALVDGIRQFRLIRSEKELLDKTLRGSINMLADLLSLIKPEAFGRANRIAGYVKDMVLHGQLENGWVLETAAMLCQIGCITLPGELIRKASCGVPLESQQKKMLSEHPAIGAEMISPIPRMEEVSRILAFQNKNYDGSGLPDVQVKGQEIPFGARIIKVITDFDVLVQSGLSKGKALERLKSSVGLYDPEVINLLGELLGLEATFDISETHIYGLKEGMILAEDVVPAMGGRKLLAKGITLSNTHIMSLRSYNRIMGVREPIKVIVPLKNTR